MSFWVTIISYAWSRPWTCNQWGYTNVLSSWAECQQWWQMIWRCKYIGRNRKSVLLCLVRHWAKCFIQCHILYHHARCHFQQPACTQVQLHALEEGWDGWGRTGEIDSSGVHFSMSFRQVLCMLGHWSSKLQRTSAAITQFTDKLCGKWLIYSPSGMWWPD